VACDAAVNSSPGGALVTKPELGTKRLCAGCGARFYDLHTTPIICPKCSTVFETPKPTSRFKGTTEREQPPVPEFAGAEAERTTGDLPEVEDDAELDDAAIIDDGEQDDGDLQEIAGDDTNAEEEN
jgi:uncharacterized protein (TIGR02300 family)